MKMPYAMYYSWPEPNESMRTVGEALYPFMLENGWEGAGDWAERAAGLAPTLVGGSKKHGGADLGPTRAKNGWLELGVDGKGLADSSPAEDFAGMRWQLPYKVFQKHGSLKGKRLLHIGKWAMPFLRP